MSLSTIMLAVQNFRVFLKRPYNEIKAAPSAERFSFWHERICLPLRLGDKVLKFACPHANDKGFVFE